MIARICLIALALATLAHAKLVAEPVTVKRDIGAMRGFLTVRSASGALLGHGEYLEFAEGDRVTSRLTLHFRDGSLDDETAVFTQQKFFQFVSDHHIQRGPFFKETLDGLLEANGNLTLRKKEKDGKESVETSHLDLPPDLSNGMLCALLRNVSPNTSELSLGMVVPHAKGRLIKLKINSIGTKPFNANLGDRRNATVFQMHMDLGGIVGVLAPIVGKQPSDAQIWILEGEVPMLVREVGQLYEGGPVVSLELAGASFK